MTAFSPSFSSSRYEFITHTTSGPHIRTTACCPRSEDSAGRRERHSVRLRYLHFSNLVAVLVGACEGKTCEGREDEDESHDGVGRARMKMKSKSRPETDCLSRKNEPCAEELILELDMTMAMTPLLIGFGYFESRHELWLSPLDPGARGSGALERTSRFMKQGL